MNYFILNLYCSLIKFVIIIKFVITTINNLQKFFVLLLKILRVMTVAIVIVYFMKFIFSKIFVFVLQILLYFESIQPNLILQLVVIHSLVNVKAFNFKYCRKLYDNKIFLLLLKNYLLNIKKIILFLLKKKICVDINVKILQNYYKND